MSLTAFALVVTAAFLHALWNLTAKRVSGNLGVFWVGLCMAAIVLAPLPLCSGLRSLDPAGLPFVVATGILNAAYFGFLAAAYRDGELSTVYPLARGTGVAGTSLVACTVLDEKLSAVGVLGIAAVCGGILLLGWQELRRRHPVRPYLWAVLVGLATTGYSTVDKRGVAFLSPVVYLAGMAAGTALFLAPLALVRHRPECRAAWRNRKGQSLWIGLASMGTYLLILCAFRQANASYVVATRELSIAVAAVLSVAVLQERLTRPKALATVAIVVGVVLVKLA